MEPYLDAPRSGAQRLPSVIRLPSRLLGGPGHQLPSQGMLSVYGGRGSVGCWEQAGKRQELWRAISPLVEKVWERDAHHGRQPAGALPELAAADVEAVLAVAESAGVCSVAQVIAAARDYLLGDDGLRLQTLAGKALGERVRLETITGLSLEPIDEGHTASVLRLGVRFAHREPLWIALQVARDLGAASARLGAQASDLRVWHRLAPARAVEVLDDGAGVIRWFGQRRELTVVAARWVEGRAVRVGEQPPGLRLADAGLVTAHDALAISRDLAVTRSALATFASDGACERLLELEQGDVMARHHTVTLVGSAARSWWGPLGAWPYRLAALWMGRPSQGAPPASAGSVFSSALRLAIEGMHAGLAEVARRKDGPALHAAMLSQARSGELAQRALEGLVTLSAQPILIAGVQCALAELRHHRAPAPHS
jgi:hypothetical protein